VAVRDDQLSPQLGRLIDAAKNALPDFRACGSYEAVALLTETGAVFTGRSAAWEEESAAVEAALKGYREADAGDIDAAAFAVNASVESVAIPAGCRRVLEGIDPDLPILVKQLGRWVILPLSSLQGSA
jgi:hypothetical protein